MSFLQAWTVNFIGTERGCGNFKNILFSQTEIVSDKWQHNIALVYLGQGQWA